MARPLHMRKSIVHSKIETNRIKSECANNDARVGHKTNDENTGRERRMRSAENCYGRLAAESPLYYDAFFTRIGSKYEASNAQFKNWRRIMRV